MEYPESEELQEVYESLSQANTENDLLRRERDGLLAEVERLRAVNAELLEALRDLLAVADAHDAASWNWESDEAVRKARAAIAQAVQP